MSATLVTTPIREGFTTLTPYVMVREAGLVVYVEDVDAAFDRALAAGGRRSACRRIGHTVSGQASSRIRSATTGTSPLTWAEGGAEPMPGAFYLYVGDADMLYQLALAAGAKSLWPPAEQPYGDRVGAVEDSIGNQWFIARPA